MADQNSTIKTTVVLDTAQAQQQIVKLNSLASDTTKTLEERIAAKNKAVELQNNLSKKTLEALNNERRSLEGQGASVKKLTEIKQKLDKANLEAVKTNESGIRTLNKLTESSNLQNNSVKSLKLQLREAVASQGMMSQKYGETSVEALNAAQAVAKLKDQIKFNADLVKGFDPDQKFKALGAATQLSTTALSAGVSGMALFGEQSEDTQKALLKVQAAMAFSQAISGLSNIGDQYKILKSTIVGAYLSITGAKAANTIATEANIVAENQSIASKIKGTVVTGIQTVATTIATGAQWLWNKAIMANPFVALITIVAAAAAGIYLFAKSLSDSAEANEKANLETKKLKESLDQESKSLIDVGKAIRTKNSHTVAMAKANGESAESIRKLERKLIDEQVAVDKASAITARNTLLQERNSLAKLRAADASSEVIEAREKEVQVAYDTFKRENSQLKSSYEDRRDLIREHEVQVATEKIDARKRLEDQSKKIKEKEDADDKKDAEEKVRDLKKFEEEKSKAESEIALSKKKEGYERDKLILEQKLIKDKADLDQLKITEEQKIAQKLLLEQIYQDKLTELKDANFLKEEESALTRRDKENETKISLAELELEEKKIKGESDLALELKILQQKKDQELLEKDLTGSQKLEIEKYYENESLKVIKIAEDAKKAARKKSMEAALGFAAEAFGLQKEVAIAEMIIAAPKAVGESFKTAASAYAPPLSLAMGALGAAGVIVPIVKGLQDIKKTKISKGSSKSSANANIAPIGGTATAITDISANNAARLGVDPSLGNAASSNAANNVMGGSAGRVIFSENQYKDFQNQVQFKEDKIKIG